jgi:hypothetical protein
MEDTKMNHDNHTHENHGNAAMPHMHHDMPGRGKRFATWTSWSSWSSPVGLSVFCFLTSLALWVTLSALINLTTFIISASHYSEQGGTPTQYQGSPTGSPSLNSIPQ